MLLEPAAEAFCADGWTNTGLDWHTELRPHFDTAAAALGRAPNPSVGLQDEWLRESARLLGAIDTFGPTPQGIDFDNCIGCGQCISGCPHGVIKPQSRVEILMPLRADGTPAVPSDGGDPSADGAHGWRAVIIDPLARTRCSSVTSVTAPDVVLAAGVLGTTQLLLANRDRWRTLPRLSRALGTQVRTNSEAFAAVLHQAGTDITFGATISSHYYPDPLTHVTNNRFPRSYSFMKSYPSPAVPPSPRSVAEWRLAPTWTAWPA